MSDMRGFGAAVIGTGFIGAVHAGALRRLGVSVKGVLGSSPERAEARLKAMGAGHVYTSLYERLDVPAVDAVHVASPNHAH